MNNETKELLQLVPLFAGTDFEELSQVLKDCEVCEFQDGELICREGEYDDNCSVILRGNVQVILPQKGAKRSKTVTLGEGEIFGEIAVISGNPRTADIISSKVTTLLQISRQDLFAIFNNFPLVKKRLDALYRERALISHLMMVPIFSGIPINVLEELSLKVGLHSSEAGECIFKEGDPSDDFYFVRYGFVKVHQEVDHKEKVLAYLTEGHFFGEMGLLEEGATRMASVTATTRSELISIKKEDFNTLLDEYPHVRTNLNQVVERRRKRNEALQDDAYLGESMQSVVEKGLIQAKAMLIIDSTKCVQCDNCVDACAVLHDGTTRLTRKGVRFNNFLLIPTSCRHCEDPVCMIGCPTGAIARDHDGEYSIGIFV